MKQQTRTHSMNCELRLNGDEVQKLTPSNDNYQIISLLRSVLPFTGRTHKRNTIFRIYFTGKWQSTNWNSDSLKCGWVARLPKPNWRRCVRKSPRTRQWINQPASHSREENVIDVWCHWCCVAIIRICTYRRFCSHFQHFLCDNLFATSSASTAVFLCCWAKHSFWLF